MIRKTACCWLLVLGGAAWGQDYAKPQPAKEQGVRGELRVDSRFELALSAEADRWASYTVYVPEGCQSLHVEVEGSDGDVDLFLRHERPMDDWYAEADHTAATGLGDEILLVDAHVEPALRPGKYYLDVVRSGDDSISPFQVTVRFDHVDAASYVRRGSLRNSEGDFEGALADLGRALALDPQSAVTYRGRAKIRAGLPEPDREGAAADYARALELDPSLDAEIVTTITETKELTFQLAEEPRYRSYKLVVPAGCRALRVQAIAAQQDLDLYLRHGLPINDWTQDPEHAGDSRRLAEELFVDAKESPPLLPGVYYLDVLRSGPAAPGETVKLRVSFDPTVDLDQDAGYWFTRGYAAAERDDTQVAAQSYSRSLQITPDPLVYFNRAVVRRELMAYAESNEDLAASLKLDASPAFMDALLYFRGNNHRNLEDLDASVRDLRAAVELSPENALYKLSLGQSLLDRGDISGAEQALLEGLELEPQSGYGHYHLAQLRGLQGNLEQALELYELALSLDPSYTEDWEEVVTDDRTLVVLLPAGPTNFRTYVLEVPEGVKALRVSTQGATANVNLHARFGLPMRNWITDPDAKADGEAADETLVVPVARPGRYFLDVDRPGPEGIRAFQLTITFVRGG